MKEKNIKKSVNSIIAIAVILVIGAYYLGVQHGKSASKAQFASGFTGGTRGGGARGAGIINGSVVSKDATSMTIQGRDGSSKIVLYSESTQIMKTAAGTSTDVAVGSQVMVAGKTNSDGSITAQTVSLRPNMPTSGPGIMPQ